MERVMIVGCACVIISSLSPEEIDRIKAYEPKALTLTRDGEDCFSIDIGPGQGSITESKAVYSRIRTEDGKATITIQLDPDTEDRTKAVSYKFGASLLKLDELEKQLLIRNECVKGMENTVLSMISRE